MLNITGTDRSCSTANDTQREICQPRHSSPKGSTLVRSSGYRKNAAGQSVRSTD